MKTKLFLTAAAIAVGFSGPALAGDADMMTTSTSSTVETTPRDDGGFFTRVVRFPGRVVYTVFRAPLIVGETALGQRRIISRDGFFAADEEQRRSLTMRRVAFAGDIPDND